MLQTKNLTKVFTTEEVETTALNKVNLEVQEGEVAEFMKGADKHADTPRLWLMRVVRDLCRLKFRPCKHEPCL